MFSFIKRIFSNRQTSQLEKVIVDTNHTNQNAQNNELQVIENTQYVGREQTKDELNDKLDPGIHNDGENHFNDLPNDIAQEIAKFLNLKDKVRLSGVNKHARKNIHAMKVVIPIKKSGVTSDKEIEFNTLVPLLVELHATKNEIKKVSAQIRSNENATADRADDLLRKILIMCARVSSVIGFMICSGEVLANILNNEEGYPDQQSLPAASGMFITSLAIASSFIAPKAYEAYQKYKLTLFKEKRVNLVADVKEYKSKISELKNS